jgi:hypothetical protein
MSEDPKGLLRQCAENLLNAVTRLESGSGESTSPQATSTPHSTNTTQPMVRRTPAEEHRSLFGYRPPSASRSNNRPPPPKRRMVTTSSGQRISVPVRNTWSHTFVCLMKKNALSPPNAADKVSMALVGLGEKTITFSKCGNSVHVHEKILEAYPMLASVGGYRILRTGERGNRQLIVLPIRPGGYTVDFLKSTLASAKGYIRPFQKDITVDHSSGIGDQSQVCNFRLFITLKIRTLNCKHNSTRCMLLSSKIHDISRQLYFIAIVTMLLLANKRAVINGS